MGPRWYSAILWTLLSVNSLALVSGGLITWLGYAIPTRLKQFGLTPELTSAIGVATILLACLGLCALNYSSHYALNIYASSCALFVLLLIFGLPFSQTEESSSEPIQLQSSDNTTKTSSTANASFAHSHSDKNLSPAPYLLNNRQQTAINNPSPNTSDSQMSSSSKAQSSGGASMIVVHYILLVTLIVLIMSSFALARYYRMKESLEEDSNVAPDDWTALHTASSGGLRPSHHNSTFRSSSQFGHSLSLQPIVEQIFSNIGHINNDTNGKQLPLIENMSNSDRDQLIKYNCCNNFNRYVACAHSHSTPASTTMPKALPAHYLTPDESSFGDSNLHTASATHQQTFFPRQQQYVSFGNHPHNPMNNNKLAHHQASSLVHNTVSIPGPLISKGIYGRSGQFDDSMQTSNETNKMSNSGEFVIDDDDDEDDDANYNQAKPSCRRNLERCFHYSLQRPATSNRAMDRNKIVSNLDSDGRLRSHNNVHNSIEIHSLNRSKDDSCVPYGLQSSIEDNYTDDNYQGERVVGPRRNKNIATCGNDSHLVTRSMAGLSHMNSVQLPPMIAAPRQLQLRRYQTLSARRTIRNIARNLPTLHPISSASHQMPQCPQTMSDISSNDIGEQHSIGLCNCSMTAPVIFTATKPT